MVNKIKRILRLSAWFTLCSVFVLSILKPFGVQIVSYNGLLALLLDFADMAGIAFVASSICVFFNLFKDDGTVRGYVRDMAIVWLFSIVIFTLLQWLVFDREYYLRVLPSIIYISLVILGFQTLCYWIRNLYRERNELQAINEMLRKQQEQDDAKDIAIEEQNEVKTCVLRSEYGDDNLRINPKDFIYVESVGNYANVCIIQNDEIMHKTLRTTIKQLKEELADCDRIVQCHRGFLVNLMYVESLESVNGNLLLNLFCVDKKIPVSRTNKNVIKETLVADHQ